MRRCNRLNGAQTVTHLYQEGIEVVGIQLFETGLFQSIAYGCCFFMDGCTDAANAVLPMVHGIHRGHYRQKRLCGTDVAGRLVTSDVLLTGLQRHP